MPKYIRYYTSKSCKDGTLLTVSVAERNLRGQEKDNAFVKTRFYLVLHILTGSTCRNRQHEVEPRTNGELKNVKIIENNSKRY